MGSRGAFVLVIMVVRVVLLVIVAVVAIVATVREDIDCLLIKHFGTAQRHNFRSLLRRPSQNYKSPQESSHNSNTQESNRTRPSQLQQCAVAHQPNVTMTHIKRVYGVQAFGLFKASVWAGFQPTICVTSQRGSHAPRQTGIYGPPPQHSHAVLQTVPANHL